MKQFVMNASDSIRASAQAKYWWLVGPPLILPVYFHLDNLMFLMFTRGFTDFMVRHVPPHTRVPRLPTSSTTSSRGSKIDRQTTEKTGRQSFSHSSRSSRDSSARR